MLGEGDILAVEDGSGACCIECLGPEEAWDRGLQMLDAEDLEAEGYETCRRCGKWMIPDEEEEEPICDDPNCPGYFLKDAVTAGDGLAEGWYTLERCDQCKQYEDDEKAAHAHFEEVIVICYGSEASPSYETCGRTPWSESAHRFVKALGGE
jgi:hypothetical protein